MSAENRKSRIFIFVVLLLSIILVTVGCLGFLLGSQSSTHTIYIGLNDKDTYTQLISTEDAEQIVHTICLQYVDGYTMYQADGYWKDADGKPTKENTLVCVFVGTDKQTVRIIADEVIEALNQNTVLIVSGENNAEFYSGTNAGA